MTDFVTEERANRIALTIALLQAQIHQIKSEGDIAPAHCCVLRYRAKGNGGSYWYYKLHAKEAIFPTKDGGLSKYKHLGRAGSKAHIEAVHQVARRTQIDGLERMLTGLTQAQVEFAPTTPLPEINCDPFRTR